MTRAQFFPWRKSNCRRDKRSPVDSELFLTVRCSSIFQKNFRFLTIKRHRDQDNVTMSLAGFKKQINKANQVMKMGCSYSLGLTDVKTCVLFTSQIEVVNHNSGFRFMS